MPANDETSPASPSDADRPRAPDAGADEWLDPIFTEDLLHTLITALPSTGQETEQQKHRRMAAAVMALRSFDTQAPIEAILATHVVLAHHAAAQCYRRAAQHDQPVDLANRLLGNAARLSGTLTRTLGVLERWQDRSTGRPRGDDAA